MKLSIYNLNIDEKGYVNFIGHIFDTNRKWHTQVNKVTNKMRNSNGILHKFKYVSLI